MQQFCYLFLWLVTLTVLCVFLIARFGFFQLQFLAAGFWCVFAHFSGSKYLCTFEKKNLLNGCECSLQVAAALLWKALRFY